MGGREGERKLGQVKECLPDKMASFCSSIPLIRLALLGKLTATHNETNNK